MAIDILRILRFKTLIPNDQQQQLELMISQIQQCDQSQITQIKIIIETLLSISQFGRKQLLMAVSIRQNSFIEKNQQNLLHLQGQQYQYQIKVILIIVFLFLPGIAIILTFFVVPQSRETEIIISDTTSPYENQCISATVITKQYEFASNYSLLVIGFCFLALFEIYFTMALIKKMYKMN